ncbi:YciI family protein [Mucilaginibacter sp. UR6-11]|uniref:YciI family protein n=1 Tax=Mucilaginibacter sp. UR6-11 TaxID=1435644 RepID=UPI001E5C0A5C|nr:YciI family protein [Mucilaginibacter sp. UR6-11]MCC8424332.1 YciI family protein [Mucilaginibacter sp. UR6-11]
MNDFLLIFRRDAGFDAQLTPAQLQAISKPWQDWMGGLAAQNKLADSGNRLAVEGKVVKPGNVITNGPYVEIKEAIGGYIVVRAASLDEAAELSKGCPILTTGGNVEVRQIVPMQP